MVVHKYKASESGKTEKVVEEPTPKRDTASKKKTLEALTKKRAEKVEKVPREKKSGKTNILRRIGGYFKGAWIELRQVHWPNRKQTWSLTLAVLLFSVLFGAMIFAIDALFVWLFNKVIF